MTQPEAIPKFLIPTRRFGEHTTFLLCFVLSSISFCIFWVPCLFHIWCADRSIYATRKNCLNNVGMIRRPASHALRRVVSRDCSRSYRPQVARRGLCVQCLCSGSGGNGINGVGSVVKGDAIRSTKRNFPDGAVSYNQKRGLATAKESRFSTKYS